MMHVWHAKNLSGFGYGFGREPSWPTDYELVAEVSGPSIDFAFERTNHIHGFWWENTGVALVGEPNRRSTSVGDVVVDTDGVAHRCDRHRLVDR